MTNFLSKIQEAHNSEKTPHLVVAVEASSSGSPRGIFGGFEGGTLVRLGLIELAMRQLDEMRQDIIDAIENNVAERTDVKSPIVNQDTKLKQALEKLPPELRESVDKLMDKVKTSMGDLSKENIKDAFVQDTLKEINKRFGFEGNPIQTNNPD